MCRHRGQVVEERNNRSEDTDDADDRCRPSELPKPGRTHWLLWRCRELPVADRRTGVLRLLWLGMGLLLRIRRRRGEVALFRRRGIRRWKRRRRADLRYVHQDL